jgi:hypothetical protein
MALSTMSSQPDRHDITSIMGYGSGQSTLLSERFDREVYGFEFASFKAHRGFNTGAEVNPCYWDGLDV